MEEVKCFPLFTCLFLETLQGKGCNLFLYIFVYKAEKNCPEEFYKKCGKLPELKIIFSIIAGSKTTTFLKLRYLEFCLNFYGLVKVAYGDKLFDIAFNFILTFLQ